MKPFGRPSGARFGMALKLTVTYSDLLVLIIYKSLYF